MKKEYYIKLNDGQTVLVSEKGYRAYKRPAWREAKAREVRLQKERSLDILEEDSVPISDGSLVEQIVEDKLLLEMLMEALEMLTVDERFLINELYFNNKTERDLSDVIGISQPAVHKKRNKILEKLKKYLE